jgi:hypothetical protein
MARERGLAEHVSAGLVSAPARPSLQVVEGMKGQKKTDPLDQRQYGKTIRAQVQEFGVVFALLFTIIAGFQLKHPERIWITLGLLAAAAAFFVLGKFVPRVMHPFWKGWMFIGAILGIFVNFVLLSLVWLVMVIPFGIALKLIGKRVMDLSFRAPVDSYWQNRDEKLANFELLERQF